MGMILKVIVAFGIGLGALTAAQYFWVSAVTSQIRAEATRMPAPKVQGKLTFSEDGAKLREAMRKMYGGPIDTSTGQRLAVESAARRIDLQNRAALNAVPLPPRIPGVPRR